MASRIVALAAVARSFDYRNLGYLAFVASLFSIAPLLNAQALDPEDGGGLGLALSLWAAVSIAFSLTSAVLAVIAAARGQPLGAASIACALPVLCLIACQIAAALLQCGNLLKQNPPLSLGPACTTHPQAPVGRVGGYASGQHYRPAPPEASD